VFGSLGSYVSSQTDVQAQAIFAGARAIDDLDGWGYEVPERGTLSTADGTRRVPSAQGRYADYYAAVAGVGPQPVPAAEAVATLAVLDAARFSAVEGVTVTV
jgi:predicted dehydrogenase